MTDDVDLNQGHARKICVLEKESAMLKRILVAILLTMMAFVPEGVLAIETPEYEVIEVLDGGIEIRAYAPFRLATTIVEGKASDAGNAAFRRLAGYIFGANADETKIAMTAPVIQSAVGSSRFEVGFFMPRTIDSLPLPNDSRVEMKDRTMTVAVLKYQGSWRMKRYEEHLSVLKEAMKLQVKWRAEGEEIWARYDSPFKPWFLKTNEIMVPVVKAGAKGPQRQE